MEEQTASLRKTMSKAREDLIYALARLDLLLHTLNKGDYKIVFSLPPDPNAPTLYDRIMALIPKSFEQINNTTPLDTPPIPGAQLLRTGWYAPKWGSDSLQDFCDALAQNLTEQKP